MQYSQLVSAIKASNTQLVAVSKTRPDTAILNLYEQGQRDFGENRVQELVDKSQRLPQDIHWHFIGHLQSKKVKYIAPFVHLIHSLDSFKLMEEVNKQAARQDRIIDGLIQFHIASEENKYGFRSNDLDEMANYLSQNDLPNLRLIGVMGMATFTSDQNQVRSEFQTLHKIFQELKSSSFQDQPSFQEISMGMSGDYPVAIEEGSTMVRIGSLLFN